MTSKQLSRSVETHPFVYRCRKCHGEIGEGQNRWERLSRSYAAPSTSDVIFEDSFHSSKDLQEAAIGSELEGSLVRILTCKDCGTGLGLTCVEPPLSRPYYKDRLVFKLAKIIMIDVLSGGLCEPEIIEPRVSSSQEPSHPQPQLQSTHISQPPPKTSTKTKSRTKVRTMEVAHPEDVQVQLDAQSEDIDRIMGLMEHFRRDVEQIRGLIVSLQTEVRSAHVFPEPGDPSAAAIPSKVSRQLTTTTDRIGANVSEVDALKTELDRMRQKVWQLEESGPPAPTAAMRSSRISKPLKDLGNSYRPSPIGASDSTYSFGEPGKPGLPASRITTTVKRKNSKPSGDVPGSQNLHSQANASVKYSLPPPKPVTIQNPIASSTKGDSIQSTAPNWPIPKITGHTRRETLTQQKDVAPVEAQIAHDSPRTDVTGKKRKRKATARSKDMVEWATIEDDDLNATSSGKEQSPGKAAKNKGSNLRHNRGGDASKRVPVDSNLIISTTEQPEAAAKRRKAEIAARDLEAQRLMEREDTMSLR